MNAKQVAERIIERLCKYSRDYVETFHQDLIESIVEELLPLYERLEKLEKKVRQLDNENMMHRPLDPGLGPQPPTLSFDDLNEEDEEKLREMVEKAKKGK